MSTRVRYSKALDGTDYIPGCIGLVLRILKTELCHLPLLRACQTDDEV